LAFNTFVSIDIAFMASIRKSKDRETVQAATTSFSTSQDYRTITHQFVNRTILDSVVLTWRVLSFDDLIWIEWVKLSTTQNKTQFGCILLDI